MQVSTKLFNEQQVRQFSKLTADIQEKQEKISSGRAILKASDDPVAAVGLSAANEQKLLLERFEENVYIAQNRLEAGDKVEEKLWRMPLHKNFDKLINSKNADMQNINYVGGAGSTTAAQFLQRFVLNKTPWAHLDIAGMAFSKYGGALNSGGATGYGVRLLNKLIEDDYE